MLKKDVRIGSRYEAKISNRIVVVRIEREHRLGGWEAVNESTGRTIRIKSAAKLRRERGPKSLENMFRF